MMKKIDLHIHTVSTIRDSEFSFNLQKLQEYIKKSKLDAIAITNHNIFDVSQFEDIKGNVSVKVFPGIEINLEKGHLLLIGEDDDLDDFALKCNEVSKKIRNEDDFISMQEFKDIFGDLNNYLFIPHYEKKPKLNRETINELREHITSGEVNSPKQFIYSLKDQDKLVPVYFSDCRISDNLDNFPTRQTFVDCGDITLKSLKVCLNDKGKVSLSEAEGNRLFQVFDNGQKLSTGLNVVVGERSSGKTYTLNRINDELVGAKYIRQFSLLQQEDSSDEKKFNEYLNNQHSLITEEYLKEYRIVLNEVLSIDLARNDKEVSDYLDSLLKSAMEAEKKDAFSKTALFDENEFKISGDNVLTDLINSVRQLIENVTYKDLIEKHLEKDNLKQLALELIELLWNKNQIEKKKKLVNETVREIKKKLQLRTSATQITEVDFYKNKIEEKKIERFEEITKYLQMDSIIKEENVQGFKVVAKKGKFNGAGEIKKISGSRTAFSEAYKEYNTPFAYLLELKKNDNLIESEFYKYFVKIEYRILNRDGFEVSGGERSEFKLLQQINDAQKYEILLIDEPESSFDNIFLNSEVNQIIKDISKNMPVVVVTHNSTVGASIQPDYLIYTSKEFENGEVKYGTYSGYPTDKELTSLDGKKKLNFEITLNCLEAGNEAYNERRKSYENLKD